MARDPKYDILFEPIKIGPKTLRNRFYVTPHCCGFGVDYPGSQAYLRAVRAEGGWAAVNTEQCGVLLEGDDEPWTMARICDANDVRNLSLLCERVHEQGALAGIELGYTGGAHSGYGTRLPARGVSQLANSRWGSSCYEISIPEIRELQHGYVAAAKRARDAGFDLIQIHLREAGSITYQFLMKYHNKRSDEYGGSFENRARFTRETVELVREAVGDTCAIVVGFCVDTRAFGGEDGLRVEEDGVAFIEHLDKMVDLWDLQVDTWMDDAGPSRFFKQNWQRPWIQKIRPHTKKPIVGVGRFTDPDVMVDAIRSGQIDIIGAARPAIADPFLPKKIEEGRLSDIRECIGCNMCASRWNIGGKIICTQNPTCGEEYRRGWHPEEFVRARNANLDVVVIGAGPAGMECAMVLGKRGMHRVHLVDADEEIGGIMRWIPNFRGLTEWGRLVSYRKAQLAKLKNVEILTGTRLDVDAIKQYGAELVILATGARWDGTGTNAVTHRPIPGADATLPHVLTPEQVMVDGKAAPGDRVLVFDCDGYFMGPSIAEKLALEGNKVTLVSPAAEIGAYMVYTGEHSHMMRALLDLGVELCSKYMVTGIAPGCVTGRHVHSGTMTTTWEADAVVLVTQRLSNNTLYSQLLADFDQLAGEGIVGVYRIGDCLEPRSIADCIFDGHRLAREIDTDDPSRPLPMIREHRVLGVTDIHFDQELSGRDVRQISSVLSARGLTGDADLS